MRVPAFLKALCQRRQRREAAIVELLNRTPGREYTANSICRLLHDWAGVIHPALLDLERRGIIFETTDGYGRTYYRSAAAGEGMQSSETRNEARP